MLIATVSTNWRITVPWDNESKSIARFRAWRAGAKFKGDIVSCRGGFVVGIPKLEAQSRFLCFGHSILSGRGSAIFRRKGAIAPFIGKSGAGNDGGEIDTAPVGDAVGSIGWGAVGINVVDDICRQTFGVIKAIAIGLVGKATRTGEEICC